MFEKCAGRCRTSNNVLGKSESELRLVSVTRAIFLYAAGTHYFYTDLSLVTVLTGTILINYIDIESLS